MGEGLFWGEQCRAACHGVPCGSTAGLREPRAGTWATVSHPGVLEEGHSGAVLELEHLEEGEVAFSRSTGSAHELHVSG